MEKEGDKRELHDSTLCHHQKGDLIMWISGPGLREGSKYFTLSTPLVYVWPPYHKPSVSDTVQASDTLPQHGVPNSLLIDTSRSPSCHLVKVKSCKSVIREVDLFSAGSLAATNEQYYCVSPYDPTTLTLVGCIMMHRRSGWVHNVMAQQHTDLLTRGVVVSLVRDPNKSSDVTCTTTTRSQFNTPPGPPGRFCFGHLAYI